MGIRLTAKLTDFSGWLIFGGSILIAVVCLAAADSWDFGRLFTFKNYSGEAGGSVWPRGLERLGLRARPPAADLHHHRLRRLGAYLRGDAEGRALGAAGDGDVGGLVGALRLSVPGRLRA